MQEQPGDAQEIVFINYLSSEVYGECLERSLILFIGWDVNKLKRLFRYNTGTGSFLDTWRRQQGVNG
jgi:hypothetical protein